MCIGKINLGLLPESGRWCILMTLCSPLRIAWRLLRSIQTASVMRSRQTVKWPISLSAGKVANAPLARHREGIRYSRVFEVGLIGDTIQTAMLLWQIFVLVEQRKRNNPITDLIRSSLNW